MSFIYLRQSEVKARKMHVCICCGEEIDVGEKYICRVGATEGSIIDMKMHTECEKESSGWDNEDWEIFERGTMERPSHIKC